MKKVLPIILCIAACAFLACSAHDKPGLTPLPTEKPLYGVTGQGVFFIHDALVKNAGGTSIRLASQATEWKRRAMKKKGAYHIFDCNSINHDKSLFVFYKNFKIQYCFYIDKYVSIPDVFSDSKDILKSLDPKDISTTLEYGFVFFTKPMDDNPHLW